MNNNFLLVQYFVSVDSVKNWLSEFYTLQISVRKKNDSLDSYKMTQLVSLLQDKKELNNS